jgi:hypothetical protein
MTSKNILPELWEEIKDRKVLAWLDKDQLHAIILDGDRYWYEKQSYTAIPSYVLKYLSTKLHSKGYKYLYE